MQLIRIRGRIDCFVVGGLLCTMCVFSVYLGYVSVRESDAGISMSHVTLNLSITHRKSNASHKNLSAFSTENQRNDSTLHQRNDSTLRRNGTQYLSYVEGIGRLGNWMFQYSSSFGIAARSNHTFVISKKNDLKNYFVGLSAGINPGFEDGRVVWEKLSMGMCPPLLKLQGNVSLCCYLQSWKYFEGMEDMIRQQLRFKDSIKSKSANKLSTCRRTYQSKYNASAVLVGIHVRRADVTIRKSLNDGYLSAPSEYFERAMRYYQDRFKHVVFVIASDDHTWCRSTFKVQLNNVSACLPSSGDPAEDMSMLAQCDHTIVSVGSFGWWAAFLANGQVVYYKDWPRKGSPVDVRTKKEDLFPPHWVALA